MPDPVRPPVHPLRQHRSRPFRLPGAVRPGTVLPATAAAVAVIAAIVAAVGPSPVHAATATAAATNISAAAGPVPADPPQGTQPDATYAASYAAHAVSNVDATGGTVSCYRPEVPLATSDGPVDGYDGMTPCADGPGGATTREDTGAAGPYPTQSGSNPGYPAGTPMLVKDHSESDLRVDPTNPAHLIGSSKWFVGAEGYNHLLGFYESFDHGATWPVSGHIPGYEGWTDNTDPVGAFDSYGNYYSLLLPYEFIYNADGTKNYTVGVSKESNPAVPSEVISVAVRPHGARAATGWITTHRGAPDYVATYDSVGNAPDKQWITIDTNPASPHLNRIYAMWVDFHSATAIPFVSYADARPDGTHTDWSKPARLPLPAHSPQGATYLLPHVAPDGSIWTSLTNFDPSKGYCCVTVSVDASTDGGVTWTGSGTAVQDVTPPPYMYANTTFRDGIESTFTVGTSAVNGHYPLYVSYEDYSAGVDNIGLTASYDGGATWSAPIRVNDNTAAVDEFQPNLTTAPDGTIALAFYDRRLSCPAAGSTEASAAGLALDTANPRYTGSLPPYGAGNYCVNASVQYYDAVLHPHGGNIRLSAHSYDPQLNSPHDGCPTCTTTFLGDYFGTTVARGADGGLVNYSTFVSTYDYGDNPRFRQQQIVSAIRVP